jgi:GNAT superfamily N-acetyltransferase
MRVSSRRDGHHLRPLRATDLPALAALADAAEAEGFRFVTRFLADFERGAVRLGAPTEFFFGGYDGDTLVALGGITPDPYVADRGVGRLRHVYVARAYRRHGVGRALVTALERRGQGVYERLRLRTDTAAAAQFYERLGYQRVVDPTATHARALRAGADVAAT